MIQACLQWRSAYPLATAQEHGQGAHIPVPAGQWRPGSSGVRRLRIVL